ncbi:MAG TPA: FAD-dependent oxidoreductase [Acidimicrobiales bacterium]|nr:FAD-dependent oxidoreductase [Acidimicrobiales bacterium]
MRRDAAVVVGASLAGVRAAEALRRGGHDGPLTVVGAEDHHPYDRPPLSKRFLTGRVDVDGLTLGADDLDVEWCLGRRATALDLERARVTLDGGDDLAYDRLVIATGAQPRRVPGIDEQEGVHLLRTLDDAVALRDAVRTGSPRVVVVGGGVIGLEVASSARALGLDVTVLEAAPVPLMRILGPVIGPVCAELHRDSGVDIRLGVPVDAVVGDGRVEGVRLGGGEVIPADVVVVGVGAAPTTDWLRSSGIDLADGVLCDDRLRVRAGGDVVPGVAAAGDVARWDCRQPDGSTAATRVEHWTNAVEQGQAAAAALLHGDAAPPFAPVPYMWSDQHGRKIQLVGLPHPDDEVLVLDGDTGQRRFVAAYGRGGRLVAAVGFSRPAPVMALRRAIADGASFPPGL